MQIKSISITKSRTLGKSDSGNITRFRKITISLSADLAEKDDPDMSYKLLSSLIDEELEFERSKYEKGVK